MVPGFFCAESDSGFLRRSQVILSDSAVDLNAPKEMTAMPRKMKLGGYATHMVGKVRAKPHL